MCKDIFMTERMDYLQNIKGYSVIRAYSEALKEWEAHKSNSSMMNYQDSHEEEEGEDE